MALRFLIHFFTPRWLANDCWRQAGRVLRLASRDFFRDNGPNWAASIAYYSLLSLFPLLLATGSVAAFFVDRSWAVHRATLFLGDLLPRGSAAIERVVQQTIDTGRGPGLLSFLPLLWTASLVFNAVTRALNVAFKVEEHHTIWRRVWLRAMMMLSVGGMFLGALASSALLRWLHAFLGFLPGREILFKILLNVLPAAFILGAFFFAYRYIPRRRPAWRPALCGAALATLLFATAKPLFLGYILQTGRYTLVYGSLAGMIVIVFWTWMVAMIGLFGGQIAFHSRSLFQVEMSPSEGVADKDQPVL